MGKLAASALSARPAVPSNVAGAMPTSMGSGTTKRFKKATIKDVAERAGVSVTTVSQFLGGRVSVCSGETAKRIEEAVGALFYTPSAFGRGMRGVRTKTIGVCDVSPLEIADNALGGSRMAEGERMKNAFTLRLWHGVTEQADREDCQLLTYPQSVRENVHAVDAFANGSADGVVFVLKSYDHRPELLAARGFPLVLIGPPHDPASPVSAVYTEEPQVIDLGLTHLWSLGHRRIAHLAGPVLENEDPGLPRIEPSTIAIGRANAFRSWMKRWGEDDPAMVQNAYAWTADYVEQPVRHLLSLDRPPTAIFCANDLMALRTIKVARAMGLRVPQDLSVVGIDNHPLSAVSDPPLTTVDIDLEELGRQALAYVSSLVIAEAPVVVRRSLPLGTLVVRGTTAPARKP